ncbi:hypothetical protein Tco_0598609 [Tanacetum coccineum]
MSLARPLPVLLVSQCDGFGYDWSDQAEEEARLLVFKKNESVYEEDIKLLKHEIYLRDLDITELKRKLELATKEKDKVQLTVQKFENSSKNLSKLLDRQIMDKCKTGLGYNDVPPPYTGNFMPPKFDLVYHSLDDFIDVNESVVEKPTVETNEPKTFRNENEVLIIEDWVSDSDEENVPKVKTVEMFNKPSFAKINFVKSTEQVKSPRKTSVDKNKQNTPSSRGNKRNWNQQMSKKLGSDFKMFNKACHVCGSFDHLKNDCNNYYNNGRFAKPIWTNVQGVNKQNFSKLTRPSPKSNMVPRTVLTRSSLISVNAVRPVNTVQSRTIVNIVKGTRVNSARPKAVLSAVKGNKGNAVKASACWVWRPKHKVLDHVSRNNGIKAFDDAGKAIVETIPGKDYILLPLWTQDPPFSSSLKDSLDDGFKPSGEEERKDAEDLGNESGNSTKGKDSEVPSTYEPRINQEKDDY